MKAINLKDYLTQFEPSLKKRLEHLALRREVERVMKEYLTITVMVNEGDNIEDIHEILKNKLL